MLDITFDNSITVYFTTIFDILGTIAFAVSGANLAVEKKMDIFGVIILGVTTAVGGGIIRDIILNVTPPTAFREPRDCAIALVVSLLVFFSRLRELMISKRKTIFLMDSIGLGAFTVIGVHAGILYDNTFLAIFVGVVTGVGGGVLRDLFANKSPMIFNKQFYACASIIGAITTAFIWPYSEIIAMISGLLIVVILRILAAKFEWTLPRPK